MINLVIIEEFSLIRLGLRQLLQKDQSIKVIGESGKGSEALQLVRTLNPHVVLLDINLPDVSGLEVTHWLIANNKTLKILIVTSNDSELYSKRLLEAGALGYISKNSTPEELINAINSVYKGKPFIDETMAHNLALSNIDRNKDYLSKLSDREIEVIRMAIKGMTIKEIVEKLHINDKTIHSYRSRIFQKLHVKNDVELLIKALQHNMIKIEELHLD